MVENNEIEFQDVGAVPTSSTNGDKLLATGNKKKVYTLNWCDSNNLLNLYGVDLGLTGVSKD